MTKVVFETATLADAVKKAERVAPDRGAAFDKAAGLVLSVNPDKGVVVLQATNLAIYSKEWVDTVSSEGTSTEWRVPSKLFASVIASLPISSGSKVTLEEIVTGRTKKLHLSCGRTKAKFNLMIMDYYPQWDVFSPDDLIEVDDLGGRISMTEWAASKDGEPPYAGVHFTGDMVLACDRYRLGVAPLVIPGLTEPITVPSGILGTVLKQTGECLLGIHDGHLLLMPDRTTQIKTIVYGVEYPPVSRIMNRDYPQTVTVKKATLLETLQRTSNFSGNDRFPIIRVFFGKGEIVCMMNTEQVGDLMDAIDVSGQCDHARHEVKFSPRNLTDAVNAVPNDELTIGYDPDDSMKILYIDGGSGYESWIVPRKDLSPEEKAEKEASNA